MRSCVHVMQPQSRSIPFPFLYDCWLLLEFPHEEAKGSRIRIWKVMFPPQAGILWTNGYNSDFYTTSLHFLFISFWQACRGSYESWNLSIRCMRWRTLLGLCFLLSSVPRPNKRPPSRGHTRKRKEASHGSIVLCQLETDQSWRNRT